MKFSFSSYSVGKTMGGNSFVVECDFNTADSCIELSRSPAWCVKCSRVVLILLGDNSIGFTQFTSLDTTSLIRFVNLLHRMRRKIITYDISVM